MTFSTDIEHLQSQNPLGFDILGMCLFLAPDAIPGALFTYYTSNALTEEQEHSRPALSLDQTLAMLHTRQLITLSEQGRTFNLAPALQETLRKAYTPEQQQHLAELTVQALGQLILSLEPTDVAQRQHCVNHLRHLEAQTEDRTLTYPQTADLFAWAASELCEQENYQAAVPLLRKTLVLKTLALGPAHPAVATLLHNLAAVLEKCQEYAEAEKLLHSAISTKARTLGSSHPETLLSLNNLGQVYARQEKYTEAEASYRKALLLGKQSQKQHPVFSELYYNLAMLYYDQGKFAEAEPWLEHIYATWERDRGVEPLARAKMQHKLAVTSVALNKWRRAETFYRQALPVYQDVLGQTHHDTIQCLEELTLLYALQNRSEEMQASAQQLRVTWEKLAQSTDPVEVLKGLGALAGFQFGQGYLPEAEVQLQHMLTLAETMPESGEAITEAASLMLGVLYVNQGKQEQAIALLGNALSANEQEANYSQMSSLREMFQELTASSDQ